MDSRLSLPANTLLDGGYRIKRVVGSGGFGITYEAEDINLSTLVAIKEYYPFEFGDRDRSMSVRPKSDRHKPTFEWGRSNFLQEARTLARFEHPSIVRVTRVFEANATAYMVMRFERGQSFEAWLKSLGRPPNQDELDRIAAPLLDALEMMHDANFLHRDIAPDNIIVRLDGSPVLLDFGTARRAVAERSRVLTGIVKAGFSPQEQYASDSRLQGPWSDLYALGATLYRAVVGRPPEEAALRMADDRMPTAAEGATEPFCPAFLAAIDACLMPRHTERLQSVALLRPLLLGQGLPPASRTNPLVESRKSQQPPSIRDPGRGVGHWPAIVAAVIALVGGIYGGVEYTRWQAGERRSPDVAVERKVEPIALEPPAPARVLNRQNDAKFRVLQDTEVAGLTRSSLGDQSDANTCAERCLAHRACDAFSFHKEARFCYLVHEITSLGRNAAFVSGRLK